MTKTTALIAPICLALFASPAFAEELKKMDADTAGVYGRFLSEQFAKVKDLQRKVEIDLEKAVGLTAGGEGIILVPTKKLKKGKEHPDAKTKQGAALAYLFLSPRFNPLKDGKSYESKKLRTVVLEGGDRKITATALVLALRHVKDDEWRLYVYGSEEKPLIDVRIFEADDDQKGSGQNKTNTPLDVHVQDVKDGKAALVITVYGKYEASLPIGHKFD